YFLRGLLLLPRVGVGEEVNLRNDDAFNPERATLDELADKLAELKKLVGDSRFSVLVPSHPASVEEFEVRVASLMAELERQKTYKLLVGMLKQFGLADAAQVDAKLSEIGVPTLKELWSTSTHDELKHAMSIWQDYLVHEKAKA
ncbi:MAG: hypothetical protein KGL39_47630, partial [Patescibacteria group bacterium]|nr:hypothetical protein [Patescibacteria group bacterium]